MSQKFIPLLFLLASSGMTYAAKREKTPITTQKKKVKKKPSQSNTKEKPVVKEKATSSLSIKMTFPSTIVGFELLGGGVMVAYYYDLYLSKKTVLFIIGAICLVTAFLEATAYQPTTAKEKKQKASNASYHTLIGNLIRFAMNIGFEILGATAFFFGRWGIKGIQNKGFFLKTSAGFFILLAIIASLSAPTIAYLYSLKPQQKEGKQATKSAR